LRRWGDFPGGGRLKPATTGFLANCIIPIRHTYERTVALHMALPDDGAIFRTREGP